jgi:chaperonin cofactor prefoldin
MKPEEVAYRIKEKKDQIRGCEERLNRLKSQLYSLECRGDGKDGRRT